MRPQGGKPSESLCTGSSTKTNLLSSCDTDPRKLHRLPSRGCRQPSKMSAAAVMTDDRLNCGPAGAPVPRAATRSLVCVPN